VRASLRKVSWCGAVAALLLGGCFLEVASDAVSIQRVVPDACAPPGSPAAAGCGQFIGIPAAVQTPAVLQFASQANAFTIDLSQQDFLQAHKEFGPVTLEGALVVDEAVLELLQPGGGRTLAGVTQLQLWQLPGGSCAGCQPAMIAEYAQAPGGTTDPVRVTLAGTGANVLSLAPDGRIVLQIRAAGQVPTVSWNGVVTLSGRAKDRGSFP
jgi:hypothetical protein